MSRIVLGLDPGTVRWGLALVDDDGTDWVLPRALPAIDGRDSEKALAMLVKLVSDEGVQQIVMGLPIEMTGREGPAAKKARALAKQITSRTQLPLELVDERLTSKQAERSMRASGLSGRAQRGKVDGVAASILLETYLAMNRQKVARSTNGEA